MKMILTIAVLVLSLNVFADDMKGENFGKVKENMLSNIDKRISSSQNHRSCVAAAADKEALKACREKHHDSMKALKEERKSMKNKFVDEKKSWKDEKKKKK